MSKQFTKMQLIKLLKRSNYLSHITRFLSENRTRFLYESVDLYKNLFMQFTITINAPREKVWTTLWDDKTYREWASAFAEGSRAESDWTKGSKALFLNADDTGMVALVENVIPNEHMSLKHLGIVVNGKEEIADDEARRWAGIYENYTLTERKPGSTELLVSMSGVEIPEEHRAEFAAAWPKALKKLKTIAENGN
jgi:uncharacterized protein YndB with AHSA1/START domain